MKIYNTLSRKIEGFEPIDANDVRVYTCGPTVYDSAHIGNLSSYIYTDLLRRVLVLAGYDVKHVMNITDVDDKTIRRSRELFPDLPPIEALKKLTEELTQKFYDDMVAVGNDINAVKFVRATDEIEKIQELVRLLLDKKVAYIADDGIYFDVTEYSKNRKYGQLSKVELPSEMKSRINNDEYDKENAQDFALWKTVKPGEPSWDFVLDSPVRPAGDDNDWIPDQVRNDNLLGRPGWHIECSAMSVGSLGQPFDIHTGGIDLIFPHHENEIAQSTAGDQPEHLAKYFVHSAHLMVDGAKMAKSKNNFYTLGDIIANGFNPLDFRMLILQGHYQSSTNFSWQNLEAARNRLAGWCATAQLRWQTTDVDDDGQQEIVRNLIKQAADALLDNLNTPEALRYIDEAMKLISQDLQNVSHQALTNVFDFVKLYFGVDVYGMTPNISQEDKDLIAVREIARTNDNFAEADRIRDDLLKRGITLRDTPIGVIWTS